MTTQTLADATTMAMDVEAALSRHPRVHVGHYPTPLERLSNLGADLGVDLYVKRDDCTGLGFGGNKVRQLEFYFGLALEERADTILITGAVQSNYVRIAAAMACRFSMDCHIQLEDRVPGADTLQRTSGNVLLDRLLGAKLYSYRGGEDEAGADAAVAKLADRLREQGKSPFIIPLGPDHPPIGALGYVEAAREILAQLSERNIVIDEIFVTSGSSITHTGLLFGLRALGCEVPVTGVCVRRNAGLQKRRVTNKLHDLGDLMGVRIPMREEDVRVFDGTFAPGYGQLNPATERAITLAARREGLFLDPVYTGKTMAGLIESAREGRLFGKRILFVHTGGQPALFAYGERLLGGSSENS